MAREIERIEAPGDGLFQGLTLRSAPVIIRGALRDWKALSKWNLDYLGSVLGATEVNTEVSATNYFPSLIGASTVKNGFQVPGSRLQVGAKRPSRKVPFREFAEAVKNGFRVPGVGFQGKTRQDEGPGERLYLKEKGFIEKFPELGADVPLRPSLSATADFPTILWISVAGATTPLHYDVVHGLFAQVWGRKRFTLFAPEDISLLYPFPVWSRNSYFSRVDIEQPDHVRFPKFQQAQPIEFVLEPGEVLYLPALWWHQVESMDTAISVSYYRHLSAGQILKWPSLRARPAALVSMWDRVRSNFGLRNSDCEL